MLQPQIDRKEVLRYLGHKNQIIDPVTESMLDDCIRECLRIAKPAYTYRVFNSPVSDVLPVTGESIAVHLEGSARVIIMAATLGIQIDSAIRTCEISDLTKALILNACANDLIEKVCDQAQLEIADELNLQEYGLSMNQRFSPGYGDLPLSLQPHLLHVLNAGRKIGLLTNDSFILTPRKSVTAILGLFKGKKQVSSPKCANCNFLECTYRCKIKEETS